MDYAGVIYILTNPSFPEYVKIGYTDDLESRLNKLNNSEAIPYAFRVYAVYKVVERLKDKKLHDLIDSLNPELRAIDTFEGKKREREFYAMSPEEAFILLKNIAEISGTADRLKRTNPKGHELDDEKMAEEVRENAGKKGALTFSQYNIPIGSELVFVGDETIKVKVVSENEVELEGVRHSLSKMAQILKNYPYTLQGPAYFKYNGVKLTDIREELGL